MKRDIGEALGGKRRMQKSIIPSGGWCFFYFGGLETMHPQLFHICTEFGGKKIKNGGGGGDATGTGFKPFLLYS